MCTPREENPKNVLLTSRNHLKYFYQCIVVNWNTSWITIFNFHLFWPKQMHKLSRYHQWSQWPRPNFHHILLRSSLSKWIADISRMPKIIQSWQLRLEGTGIQRIQQHFGTSRNRKIKYKYIFKRELEFFFRPCLR